jgi:hypothetical protein
MQHGSERAVGIALAQQRAGEHAPHDYRIGLQRQHVQQRIGCLAAPALFVERKPEVRERARPVGFDRKSGASRVLRVRRSTECHQYASARLMQRGVMWNKHDRTIQRIERCDIFAKLLEKDGHQAACCGMRRLLCKEFAQRRHGFGKAAGLCKSQRGLNRCGWRL